jgi:hypothetical protein
MLTASSGGDIARTMLTSFLAATATGLVLIAGKVDRRRMALVIADLQHGGH